MSATHPDLPLSRSRNRLATWSLIRASGADARSFLHGQLSNDLLGLAEGQAQWTAYCSPKGRMLAGFLAWIDADDGVMLACDRSIVATLIKRLRMFVLRAKVVVEDVGGALKVEGLIGEPDGPLAFGVRHAGDATQVGLPAVGGMPRYLAIEPAATVQATDSDETPWMASMIRAGESWITAATQDLFVPQMVNFDALGGINFKKGCYPGQEIVARAHYRGAVKRRMYRAWITGAAETPKPGQALFSAGANAQECGQVANAVRYPDGASELLAVLSMQCRHESGIHLGAADGPALAFADLPYEFPEAA
jgi:folate-binding protein YgfZ